MRASTSSPLKRSSCVPAACSVTKSSWRTPAMRKPVSWPRWGDECEMAAAMHRAGENDIVFDQGNVDDFAGAVLSLVVDPGRYLPAQTTLLYRSSTAPYAPPPLHHETHHP